jgi:sarcosine oxidase subunit delta
MLLIPCPWCGEHAETDFSCGGEAGITRSKSTESLSDEAWADYLFMRTNPRGSYRELWNHSQGCRRWFVVERDTESYVISGSSKLGDKE